MSAEDHVKHTRAAFVDFLCAQAEWRAVRAQQWPEDPRNARSAKALGELADWVMALPDSDERLQQLAEFCEDDSAFFPVGEGSSRLASRYGFAFPAEPDRFLSAFLSLLLHEKTN